MSCIIIIVVIIIIMVMVIVIIIIIMNGRVLSRVFSGIPRIVVSRGILRTPCVPHVSRVP
jgi:hypothetical protein